MNDRTPATIIRDTRDRREVEEAYRWSAQRAALGEFERDAGWDTSSPWHNDRFRDKATGREWVIYQADHAWAGEVKVIRTDHALQKILK